MTVLIAWSVQERGIRGGRVENLKKTGWSKKYRGRVKTAMVRLRSSQARVNPMCYTHGNYNEVEFQLEEIAAGAYDLKRRNMRRPVVITAPFTTPEKTARTYGIPKRRANELRKMVEESLAKKGYIFMKAKDSTASRNGASNRASRSHRLKVKVRATAKVKSRSGNASRRNPTRAKAKFSR